MSIENTINNCIEHFAYDDAIILSEAYYAKTKSDAALDLHSSCLLRAGRLTEAYDFLNCELWTRTSRSRFLYAKCAYELDKLDEAGGALRSDADDGMNKLYEGFDEATLAHAHALQAKILRETNRVKTAQQHYAHSLIANPLLWSSIRSYCELGGESIGFATPLSAAAAASLTQMSAADRAVTELIFMLSQAQELLSRFRCEAALTILAAVPPAFAELPLAMRMRADAHFEFPDYRRCAEVYRELRRRYPSNVEGMETYSTALWQLQEAHELSALATELVRTARTRAVTWCVVGNSLSLHKQHEAAVEAFERAVQLEPRFAYAYALLGHELAGLHQLARASAAFGRAASLAPRDYRVLYGQGQVFYKSEQHSSARVVLARAAAINPRNTVLLCQLAVVEHELSLHDEAIKHLNRALELQPQSIVCRFHKARILFNTKAYRKAERELNELRYLSPDEAHVFFLLGRVHRKLDNAHLAMLNFSWATEIDPRGEQNNASMVSDTYEGDAADLNDTGHRGAIH